MATYKEIQGEAVVNTSSDITSEGQVFYNTPGNAFKLSSLTTEAWASGGNLNNGRSTMGSFGIQTAAVVAGGEGAGPFAPQGNGAEEYNGTSWTTTSNLPVAKREMCGGAGTESAGLICGGFSYPPFSIKTGTEEYNGSSWTSGGSLSSGFRGKSCLGTLQTSALAFGGDSPTTPVQTSSEEYDGSSWTGGGTMSNARQNAGGSGSVPSGIVCGGNTTNPPNNKSEEYNGTSFTTGGTMNLGRTGLLGGTQGTQTAAIMMGGPSPSTTNTELYDGTSWTTATPLTSSRELGGGGGTTASAIYSGGSPRVTSTEEFTGAGIAQTETIDVT
jgi:hypothetical protein